jgi:predicted Zn-dependent protease
MLDSGQFLGVETAFWRLWVQHHLQGRSNEDALARSRELLRLRPDSLLTMALAWSVAVEAGEEDAAQALLDDIARRWPRRAATLAARSGG